MTYVYRLLKVADIGEILDSTESRKPAERDRSPGRYDGEHVFEPFSNTKV